MRAGGAGEVAAAVKEQKDRTSRSGIHPLARDPGQGCRRDSHIRGDVKHAAVEDGAGFQDVLGAGKLLLEGVAQQEAQQVGLRACHRVLLILTHGATV